MESSAFGQNSKSGIWGFVRHGLSSGKTGFWVLALTVLLSCQSILITYSKKEGLYEYNTTTTVLLAEIFKFVFSAVSLWQAKLPLGLVVNKDTILFAIPALIYFIQNNLLFLVFTYVDPTTYQVLINLKILTTGVLFRYILGKQLSPLQWSALVLLAVGCTMSQMDTNCNGAKQLLSTPLPGLILVVVLSILSAAAGIVTEWLMKKGNLKSEPLHRQNLFLYFYGIIFNFLGYMMEASPGPGGFFYGYNFLTVLVILALGGTGLIVSFIMKYADNMVKIYAVAVSMSLTLVVSVFLFDFQPSLQMVLGISTISISIFMYFDVLVPKNPTPVNDIETGKGQK